jgi:hypothetical protein
MEDYQLARDKAHKHIRVADHILTMTYPLVNDPKLLKLVMRNIYISVQNAMATLLYYERIYKRVSSFNENFESMLFAIKPVFQRYKISPGYLSFLQSLQEIIYAQSKADVEFVRKDKFVFASNDYELNTFSIGHVRDYLTKAKLFIQQITGVVEENERIARIR